MLLPIVFYNMCKQKIYTFCPLSLALGPLTNFQRACKLICLLSNFNILRTACQLLFFVFLKQHCFCFSTHTVLLHVVNILVREPVVNQKIWLNIVSNSCVLRHRNSVTMSCCYFDQPPKLSTPVHMHLLLSLP
jgi:hypothetical protein